MLRCLLVLTLAASCCVLSGCGYHTLAMASHLPPGARSLAVPVFATRTNTYRTEMVLTNAVIREFATRTKLRVTPRSNGDADLVLHGTILQEASTPLTYNSQTEQSSSYLLTMVISVELTARDGRVLYQNNHYTFRQQYQSTTNLPTFIDENPAAVERLSRDFAHALVADLLEGF